MIRSFRTHRDAPRPSDNDAPPSAGAVAEEIVIAILLMLPAFVGIATGYLSGWEAVGLFLGLFVLVSLVRWSHAGHRARRRAR